MKVMVLTNLKPAKLAGMMSEGMPLCAEDAEGNVCLMTPEKQCRQGQRSADGLKKNRVNREILSMRDVWGGIFAFKS